MAKYNKSQLYFFKFPNTFFDSDEIEDILKDDDGPSIVILYLKLITMVLILTNFYIRLRLLALKGWLLKVVVFGIFGGMLFV